jgi:ribosomal protein L7/L12
MSKCPECGHENELGTPLCQKCGATIPAPVESTEAAEPKPEVSPEDQELLDLVSGGKKISAIKLYRERTGKGLKEAKDAVEALAREHGIASQTVKAGCSGMVLLGLAGLIGGAMYLFA